MKDFLLVVPAFKCANHLEDLYASVQAQSFTGWRMHISSDTCEDSYKKALEICKKDSRVTCSFNGNRLYALGNINKTIQASVPKNKDTIIGIIDGDDRLINNDALNLISDAYTNGANVVWTKYMWDNKLDPCISDSLPEHVDPYTYPWVSSHFRTFGNWIYNKINPENFLDGQNNFFKRAYDQALMLPILHYCNSHQLKTDFLPFYCYRYNHQNSSTPPEEHTSGSYEHQVAQFIRARGYIE